MNEDLNIFYFGGSGGFYFLHQVLLNNNFLCKFDAKINNYSLIRNKNFSSNFFQWKENEIWPINTLTKEIKNKNKSRVFFTVNDFEIYKKFSGIKILVYTDLKSQIRLSLFKNSFWFFNSFEDKPYIKHSKIKNILKLQEKNNLYFELEPIWDYFDFHIKFQDLLEEKTLCNILENLNCGFNEKNIEFMNYYKSLHPPKLLKKIGVSI